MLVFECYAECGDYLSGDYTAVAGWGTGAVGGDDIGEEFDWVACYDAAFEWNSS